MEYLIVGFRESRTVLIDSVPQGSTNVVLELERGMHSLTLAPPADFSPPEQKVLLQNTAVLDPCQIQFQQLASAAIPLSPAKPS